VAAEQPKGFIVDTNVLSARDTLRSGSPVAQWIQANAHLIRISVITVAEMRRGLILKKAEIEKTSNKSVRRREQPKLDGKTAWYDELRTRFKDRLEPIDAEVAERWADVSVRFPSLRDGDKAILATALVRGYGIATRNLGDFKNAGVPLVNPFDPNTWALADQAGLDYREP
jgi:predicted nucleic acid-binding protein